MLPMLLNQLNVISARILVPATGTWIADIDVDLDPSGIVPTGKAALTIGTSILLGTIDDRSSGKFAERAHVQLVGGGNGWDKIVPALHLHSDVGVMSTAIYSVTGASVGEVVVDTLPKRLGVDYVRTTGPASRVLAGVEWYVNNAGVTVIGPRIPQPFNPLDVQILDWDTNTKRAILASEELIQPGTILVDVRFGPTPVVVRDVEQTFSAKGGARCIAWCETSTVPLPKLPGEQAEAPGHKLARALGALAREATSSVYLRPYKYRVVLQGADKRLTLQAADLTQSQPVPAILQQVSMWPGVPGASALVTPGTEVIVMFLDGDPAKPVVSGFANQVPPIELILDVLKATIGLGSSAVIKASPDFVTWLGALGTATGAGPPPLGFVSTKLFTD